MTNLTNILNVAGADLEEENDADGFLGVKLTQTQDATMVVTQYGSTNCIIEAMGLNIELTTPKYNPCMMTPLTKDLDGNPCSDSFAYASIVGMLLYLSGHIRPDISYSVSEAARFRFCPKRLHEVGSKLIGRYFLVTRNKDLIITPIRDVNIDAYPDMYFAGLYTYEEHSNPVCVRSRTNFVITVAGYPVF